MAVKLQELRCDKQLINSNFEGYKLSLSEIPGNSMKLPVGNYVKSLLFFSVSLNEIFNCNIRFASVFKPLHTISAIL